MVVTTRQYVPEDMNKLHLKIEKDETFGVEFSDNSTSSTKGVSVYFRDIKSKLLSHIAEADAVFGAIAWFTEYDILDALGKLSNVSIIIQKEDFLRPDIGKHWNKLEWKQLLRKKYSKLKLNIERYLFPNILKYMSSLSDPTFESVRCVGNNNRDKAPAFPRMHNKFVVFAKIQHNECTTEIKPYAVWTGSFNFTCNATFSLENALFITIPGIVKAYFNEYGQIAAMSEPLDWASDWAEPEWRIGT